MRYGAKLEKHRQGFRPVAELAGSHLEADEAELLVERNDVGLGVHHHADATEIVSHLYRKRENGLEKRGAHAATPGILVGREPRQP